MSRLYQVSCSNMLLKGKIPPSIIVSSGEKTNSGSALRIFPKPVQVGQAPWGELKEKDLGSISGRLILSIGQAKRSENMWSSNFLGLTGIVNSLSRTFAITT